MKISIHGTNQGNHGADGMAIACAAVSLFKLERRTLIIPLCEYNEGRDIEFVAIGKESQASLYGAIDTFSDTGVDALLRRAESGRLTIEHFNSCTTPTVRSKNHLDIAAMTTETEFETSLLTRLDAVQTIISSAEDVYDDIILLLHSSNESLVNKIDKMMDKTIVVISQERKKEDIDLSGMEMNDDGTSVKTKNYEVLCEDYEPESKFNSAFLKKEYNIKNVFIAPHNVQYKDATNAGNVIGFIANNIRDNKYDDNDVFIASITRLMEKVLEIKEADIREKFDKLDVDSQEDLRDDLIEVAPGQVQHGETVEKRGLFGSLFYKTVKLSGNGIGEEDAKARGKKADKPKKTKKVKAKKADNREENTLPMEEDEFEEQMQEDMNEEIGYAEDELFEDEDQNWEEQDDIFDDENSFEENADEADEEDFEEVSSEEDFEEIPEAEDFEEIPDVEEDFEEIPDAEEDAVEDDTEDEGDDEAEEIPDDLPTSRIPVEEVKKQIRTGAEIRPTEKAAEPAPKKLTAAERLKLRNAAKK